jgi:tetratricopeptide (TPR) repeat protein
MSRVSGILALLALVSGVACSGNPAPGPGPVNDKTVAEKNAARNRAAAQLEAGAYSAAVRTLEPLTGEKSRDDQAFVMRGDAYRGLGEFDPAVKSYEQAIRINYGDYRSHLKLGTWLMENRKTGRALTEFEVAVKFGGDDPLTHYNYGLALHELGRREEALEQWRVANAQDPTNPDFVEALGIGLTGSDDARAVSMFADAEKLGQTGGSFFNNYALALERAGRHDAAERYFIAAVNAPDVRPAYRENLALHYMRVGDYAAALDVYRALAESEGERWSWCVYRARANVELGKFDDAIAALAPFREAVDAGNVDRKTNGVDRIPPTLAEALSALGMAYRGRKELENAREYLSRAVTLDPRESAHLNNYGVVLAESGMLPEARAQWKRVLEINPQDATARANLSAYER